MVSSFSVENRDALRQRYFEAKDRGDATAVAHAQALLGDSLFSSQHRSSRERVSLIGINLLEVAPKQLSAQARDIRPTLLSGKTIADLTQGKSFSVSEASMVNASLTEVNASLTEAIKSNQKYIWYRLGDASFYESTVMQFCHSFFTSRPMREERLIQSNLVLRIVHLTFYQQEVDPTPQFLDEMRYLIMCKVQDFVDIRFSELEEELEEVAVGRREFRKEFVQTIHKIREQATSLWSKLSALEARPLLCVEEMHLVKQALNLYETEVSYAMALDKVTGQQDYAEELRCMLALGKLYAKKRERQALIQSAGIFNYALRLIEDPQYLPTMQRSTKHARRTEILRALGQVELQLLRLMGIRIASSQEGIEKARDSILANRKNLQEKRKIIDEEIEKLGEKPSPQQIESVHYFITDLMKLFTAQLIEQCTAIIGEKPCSYAVIGLGSMARKEMTHYSDLEFAILIEERAEQHKEYFRNLTYLLHLKVVNLGETILPALNVPCLTGKSSIGFFDAITPRGFAFDGAGVQGKGCKTPLGNGTTFELIQTPTKMAQYLGRDRNGVDWPQREPHLPMELLNFVFIAGNDSLCKSYREALDEELSNLYRKGIDLRNYLAKVHLVAEDEQQFNPTLSDLEKEGQLFKVKEDLYRFPHLSIDRLALFSNLQLLSTIERIKELNRMRMGLLGKAASERLQWLICEVLFQRLKVYSHYKAHREWMNPLTRAFGLEDPQLVQKQFALDQDALEKLTRIYQILVPFYKAMKAFLNGDPLVFQQEKLWDESDFTLGQIAARLLQYEQARVYYLKVQDSSLADKATRLLALGAVEFHLGKTQEAMVHFQESLTVREKIYGQHHLYVLTNLSHIGMAYDSLGKSKEALSYYQRALIIMEKINRNEGFDIAVILNNMGLAYASLGKAQEALSFHQRALVIIEKIKGNEHSSTATILNNIGIAYDLLGKPEEALSFYQRALDIRKKIYGSVHPYVAMSLNQIGLVYNSLGKSEEALAFCQKALIIFEKVYGNEHHDVARSLANIGGACDSLGKSQQEVLSWHQKALSIWEKAYGKKHPDVARSLNNMGGAYYSLGKAEEALSFFQRAQSIWEKAYGKKHSYVALSLNNAGVAYDFLGNPQKALSFYQRAQSIWEKVYGKEHHYVALNLANIGTTYNSLGNSQEALSCYKRVLTIEEKIYGKENPNVASILNGMGSIYNSLGKEKRALFCFQRARDILEKVYGSEHPDVARSLNNIGGAYYSLGKAKKALSCYRRALTIEKKIYGKEHPLVASSLNGIGGAYDSLGKAKKALSSYQRALAIGEKIYGKKHPDVAISLNNIGSAYDSLGKVKKALLFYQRAKTIWEKIYGTKHHGVATSLNNMGHAYDSLGKVKKALLFYQRAKTIWEEIYGAEHPEVARSLNNMGAAYFSLKKIKAALSCLQRALAIWEEIYGTEHPDVATSLNNIGGVYESLEDAQEALFYYQRALTVWEKIHGNEHPNIVTSLNSIGDCYYELGRKQEALSFYQKALAISEKVYGKEHSFVATRLNHIGRVYSLLGEPLEALFCFHKALAINEKVYGEEHLEVATSLDNVGMAYYYLRSPKKALFYYQKALAVLEKIHGNEHPDVIESRKHVITAIYQTIEYPQQKIAFILAEYTKRQAGVVH